MVMLIAGGSLAAGTRRPHLGTLMPLGAVHPSMPGSRVLLTTRKLLQAKHHDVEMSLRGVLRGFGLKVGPTTPRTFPGRIRELVEGHPTLTVVAGALLAAREALGDQLRGLEKRLRDQAREDERARLLMTAPGVGVIVALTFAAAVDDPARFRSSKAVGAHFGLAPRKYQSGRDGRDGADLVRPATAGCGPRSTRRRTSS